MKGNHCWRFDKYINGHPELNGVIDFNAKIGLIDFGYEWYEYGDIYEHNGFLYTHGHRVNKHSGYTAKNMLEDLGVSGECGHTHRAGSHYKTDWGGEKVFLENGCLCDFTLSMDWFRRKLPNWQYAISVVKFQGKDFHVDQIVIPRKKQFIIYGDKYYTL
jgi:hypothetical protein